MQQEKEKLLTEQLKVKEEINRALHYVTSLELHAEDQVMHQVEKLTKVIQQLQQRITNLELCNVPDTS
jgi:hypothetical protein